MKSHIGLIGYGSMSQNISINLIKKNIFISILNKEKIKLKLKFYNINIITNCIKKFLKSLKNFKLIFILIKTGKPIKILILRLKKKLFKNDILIDFGNSFFKETYINNLLIKKKFIFLSSGISGGSSGALNGLCCMIDCNIKIFKLLFNKIKNLFFKKKNRYSCCISLGLSSSHFIKMIHNGIEYGILQLLSEIYFIFKIFFKKKNIISIITVLNNTDISCFLLKILINIIFKKKKKICDIIDHKGTGKNTVVNSINNNVNINSIFEALIVRIISKNIFLRKIMSINISIKIKINFSILIRLIKNIFLNCKLLCYLQGFNQLIIIKKKYNWKINFNNLIKSYLNSCIIDSIILYYLINHKKNFFLTKIFFNYFKKMFLIKKIILIFLRCNIANFYINSCYNFLLIISYKSYNFKIIQFERNYFGNHLLKYL